MLLAAGAWRSRQAARLALEAGEFDRALGLAREAQQMHRTSRGEFLRALSAWLQTPVGPLAESHEEIMLAADARECGTHVPWTQIELRF